MTNLSDSHRRASAHDRPRRLGYGPGVGSAPRPTAARGGRFPCRSGRPDLGCGYGICPPLYRSRTPGLPGGSDSAGHRAYLMMWHEPWDDQFNWNTYRTAQARVWNLLHNQSNANTDLVSWGILGTSWDFIQNQAQGNFFPAGGEFDWVGVDMYDMYRNL